jgi:hypothetical protein
MMLMAPAAMARRAELHLVAVGKSELAHLSRHQAASLSLAGASGAGA